MELKCKYNGRNVKGQHHFVFYYMSVETVQLTLAIQYIKDMYDWLDVNAIIMHKNIILRFFAGDHRRCFSIENSNGEFAIMINDDGIATAFKLRFG